MRIEIMLVSINYDMIGYKTVKTGIRKINDYTEVNNDDLPS